MIGHSLLFALLFGAQTPAAAAPRRLFLFGGGDFSRPAMERLAQAAGGPRAKVLEIPWASEDPGDYLRDFESHLAFSSPTIRVAPSTAAMATGRAEFLRDLQEASLVFFCGGDQNMVSDFLGKNPDVKAALKRRYAEGAVFAGISAGAAIMSEMMITGEGDFSVIDPAKVGTDRGLGLLEGAIVDQHFIARKRENRLFGLVLGHPELVGLGVDEPATLLVEDERWAEELGPGQVMVVEGQNAPPRLVLALLSSGQRYDIKKRARL